MILTYIMFTVVFFILGMAIAATPNEEEDTCECKEVKE